MIAYKLVRKMKDGSLAPLFINKKLRFELGEWHQAEDHPTSGFAHRPGFYCCLKPEAPHLKEDVKSGDRIWIEAEVEDYEIYNRPKSQGGKWVLAQKMKPIRTLDKDDVFMIKNPLCPDCLSKLVFDGSMETDFYGLLVFSFCNNCVERFVSQGGGDWEIAAP